MNVAHIASRRVVLQATRDVGFDAARRCSRTMKRTSGKRGRKEGADGAVAGDEEVHGASPPAVDEERSEMKAVLDSEQKMGRPMDPIYEFYKMGRKKGDRCAYVICMYCNREFSKNAGRQKRHLAADEGCRKVPAKVREALKRTRGVPELKKKKTEAAEGDGTTAKKRGRPNDPIFEHFEPTAKGEDKLMYVACKYCGLVFQKNAFRQRKHLLLPQGCKKVPPEVRLLLAAAESDKLQNNGKSMHAPETIVDCFIVSSKTDQETVYMKCKFCGKLCTDSETEMSEHILKECKTVPATLKKKLSQEEDEAAD